MSNDFASWVRHSLRDEKLAEQLAVLDPVSFNSLEELRYHLLERIDDRLDESEYLRWSHATQRGLNLFAHRLWSLIREKKVSEPREMSDLIPRMSVSSIFYHFIDARRRTQDKVDDFRQWLAFFGDAHQPLIDQLTGIDPYFSTLVELRQQVADTFQHFFAEQTL
jgi:Family of unknown function (DUF5752)